MFRSAFLSVEFSVVFDISYNLLLISVLFSHAKVSIFIFFSPFFPSSLFSKSSFAFTHKEIVPFIFQNVWSYF